MTAGTSKLVVDRPTRDVDAIAENQTTGGAANLNLNGAWCDLGTAGQFDVGDVFAADVGGVALAFDSAGDISTVNFTITGKDQDGVSITEVVTGVTTTIVYTTKFYSQVTQIAADAAVGSNVFIGTVNGSYVTRTIPVNKYSSDGAAVAISGLTGSCTFDLQETYDDLRTNPEAAAWFDVLSDQTADVAGVATQGASGVRLYVNSYTEGDAFNFHVSYNPYR